MSGFLLDTNIPSELMRKRPDERVKRWVADQAESSLMISAVSMGELRRGIVLLPRNDRRAELEEWLGERMNVRFRGRILPITQVIAERWGVLDAERQLLGLPLNIADGMIAATALVHGLTLVTRNVKDFAHLGVDLLNPWEA